MDAPDERERDVVTPLPLAINTRGMQHLWRLVVTRCDRAGPAVAPAGHAARAPDGCPIFGTLALGGGSVHALFTLANWK